MKSINRILYSWPLIIIFVFLFFPVGIYLAYRRAYSGREPKKNTGIGILVLGFFVLLITLYDFGSENVSDPNYTFLVVFTAVGVALLFIGVKALLDMRRYIKYIASINADGITSIDKLASSAGKPYEKTVKDLKKMIQIGYITDYFIDENKRELVAKARGSGSDVQGSTPQPQTAGNIVIKCPNCGASNSATAGSATVCEYCGAVIQ